MKPSAPFELPKSRERDARRARRLEWVTLSYLASVVVLMYLVMGSSQAMKSAWIEDLLSLVPPVAFLIADRVRGWPPNERFPYGYHRAVTIAFLFAAFALLTMGLFLMFEAVRKLLLAEHPTIGSVNLANHTIWLGWLMLPVLLWSVGPAVLIGRAKLKLAERLHDKSLYADARMNKADWLTGVAALAGVLGIAWGWWWADATAALIISIDILKDGLANSKEVIGDLMDRRPQTVDREPWTKIDAEILDYLYRLDWVQACEVRLREHGHVLYGEAFVVPTDDRVRPEQIAAAVTGIQDLDWRVHDIVIQPVSHLHVGIEEQ